MKKTEMGPVTNGAQKDIERSKPYTVTIELEGISDLLFHRWNCEAIETKAKATKGSAAKKTDNIESFVWRDNEGNLCIPGEYVRQTMVHAAKFRQDPRSPRKSAMDIFKAGIVSLTEMASLGVKDWDYEHKCRVQIQRNGITRIRPAMKKGWNATFDFMVNLPEYIDTHMFHAVLADAGKLVGIGDFRPSYGRFIVKSLSRQQEATDE